MNRPAYLFHRRLTADAIGAIEFHLAAWRDERDIRSLGDAARWLRCARTNLRLAQRALRPRR